MRDQSTSRRCFDPNETTPAGLGLARASALQATSSGDADAARVRALAVYKEISYIWKDAGEPGVSFEEI